MQYTDALVLIYLKYDWLIKGLSNQLASLGLVWELKTELHSFNQYFSQVGPEHLY